MIPLYHVVWSTALAYWVCHSRLTCTLSRSNFCLSAVQQIVKFALAPSQHAPGGNEGTKRSASIGFSTRPKSSAATPCSLPLRAANGSAKCILFI